MLVGNVASVAARPKKLCWKNNNMQINNRIKTAVVLIPIMLGGIYLLPLGGFAVFIGLIALLGAWEWADLSGFDSTSARIAYMAGIAILLVLLYLGITRDILPMGLLLAISAAWWAVGWYLVKVYPQRVSLWAPGRVRLIMGIFVLSTMWVGFYWIRTEESSKLLLTLLMLLVWGADIGAYYAGRRWGKHKLAPDVSPGKTWEGVLGGTAAVALLTLLLVTLIADTSAWRVVDYLLLVCFSALVVAISIVGDLVESMVKRHRGHKDSGRLLPGHGGIMDRIDSMSAAAPVFAAFLFVWPAL